MSIEFKDMTDWVVVAVKDRVDSFNFHQVTAGLESRLSEGKKNVALDLAHTKFLSLNSIKYFAQMARELEGKGGRVALLSPSEKLKRQIDIYASLKGMQLFRSAEDWERMAVES